MREDLFEGDEALAELRGPHPMTLLAAVMIAGAAGAGLRYLLDAALTARLGDWLPWSTLIINVVGALVVGVAVTTLAVHVGGHIARPAIVIGLVGGFTTFSALALEAVSLSQDGQVGRAGLYLLISNGLGVAAVAGGMAIGKAIL